MVIIRKISIITVFFLVGVIFISWLGLQIQPKSFSSNSIDNTQLSFVPLPAGLPAPVERFYRTVYGEEIPVIETVVIQGRGVMKPFMNIPIPARFVFIHNTGKDYRHYFEATLYGIPFLQIDEGYFNGESFFESPMGNNYNEEKMNQGANLALWGEAIWFPSIWITDPNTRWEPFDDNTAILFVPYENIEERVLIRFNPQTGLIDMIEAMRYRDIDDNSPKILWICQNDYDQTVNGARTISTSSVMWLDQGKPWAIFNAEEILINMDISSYLYKRGYKN